MMNRLACLQVLFFFPIFHLLSSDGDFRLDGQAEPNTYINGCVNAITGSFINSFPDIIVEGPEPLSFVRHYCSNNHYDRHLGCGMSHNHATNTTEFNHAFPYVSISIEESGGDRLCYTAEQKKKGDMIFFVNPKQLTKGYTNCSGGSISGRTNIKNTILKAQDTDSAWSNGKCTAFLGDGTKRYYNKDGLLIYEERPSGNRIYYNYDKDDRILLIHAVDPTYKITLGWISFSYDKDHHIHVNASNGKKGTYVLEKHHFDKRKYYSLKSSSFLGEQSATCHYSSTHIDEKNKHIVLDEIHYENGNFLKLDYHHNKVESIKVPGVDGKSKKIYEIDYHHDHTTAKDLYGGKTVYSYSDKSRLEKKERYHNGKFYSRQEFYWGGHHKQGKLGQPLINDEGFLLTKGIANSNKELIAVTTYTYDSFGNVLSETVAGNLTGNHSDQPIKMKDKRPLLDGHEVYSRYFTYSNDGFNLVTSIKDDDGLYVTLQYLPNSDKVTRKLTYVDNNVVSREYCEYNNLSILTKKIVDDGSSEDSVNLSGVTKRLITTIIPNINEGSAGFGKPLKVIESYWDFERSCEVQLKRIDYTYGRFDLVTSESCYDANNNLRFMTSYTYDDAGNCIEQLDPMGHTTQFKYDAIQQCVFKELIGSGFYTTYSYDLRGNLTKTVEHHASGEIFIHEERYDDLNRKTKDIDTFGNVTTYEYDDLGRLTKVTHPQASIESKSYNFLDQLVAETDRCGNTVKRQYTSRGQITEIQFPDGSAEYYRYNLNGTLHKKINQNQTYSLMTYDSRKRLVCEETFSSEGVFLRSKQCEYQGDKLVLEIDAMGTPTEYAYDGAGRIIGKTTYGSKQNHKEEYIYDSLGRLSITKKWFGEGYAQEIKEFDTLNRVIEERLEDASGNIHSRVRYTYDVSGNCTQKIVDQDDQHIAVNETEYTSFNLPKISTDPLGYKTYFHYDFNHRNEKGENVLKKVVVDPKGIQTISVSDVRGRDSTIEKRNSLNILLSFDRFIYDTRGLKVKHISDVISNGNKLREYCVCWDYDALGRPTRTVEDPSGKSKCTSMTYTNLGTIETLTKPDGVMITHCYDALGREISKNSSDGSIAYTFEYDLNDHLLKSSDSINNSYLSRQYDEFGNLMSEAMSDGFHVSMNYDEFQRITNLTLHDSSSIAYNYDATSMASVKRLSKHGNILYSHHYNTRNLEGRSLNSTMITGDQVNFQWDLLGRPVSINTGYTSEVIPEDGYDPVGNLLKVKFTNGGTENWESYQYDDLNQLINERNFKDHTYQYDSLCNRLGKDQFSYNLNSINQITHDGEAVYNYDLNGNLISENQKSYQYDALNRLTSVEEYQKWKVQYYYDSFGRCISRREFSWTDEWNESKFDRFIFQGIHEIGSFDKNGKIQELRILGQREGLIFRLAIAIELGDKVYAPIYDHRFNVISLIDLSKKSQEVSYRYIAYGEVATTASNHNPWLFGGKRYDLLTDLYNFGNRFYRSKIGRWISPDPGQFIDGLNLYAYTHNRPLICTDFYGFQTAPICAAYGGMAHGIPKEAFHSMGRAVEATAHHGIPFPYTQYVGEGIGRVLQGKSYEHEYTGGLQPISGKVGDRDMGNVRIWALTGIMTTPEEARKFAESISNRLDGVEVYYTCHQTQGLFNDLIKAGAEYLGITTESLTGEYQKMINEYHEMNAKYGNDFSMFFIPHSRGVLEFDLMSLLFPKAMKQKTSVFTLGGAKAISKGNFKEVINYANDNDGVVQLGKIGAVIGGITQPAKLINETFFDKPNIVYTKRKSDSWTSPIDDHYLDSEGYEETLYFITEKIKKSR